MTEEMSNKEKMAREIAPRMIAELESRQAQYLALLVKARPGHEASVLEGVSSRMPGVLWSRPEQSGLFFLSIRRPAFGESPPIAGQVTYVCHNNHRWDRSTGRVRLLRHAIQRWIQRDGGVNIEELCEDLGQAMPEISLILSVWPVGPIILPTPKGAYFGRLCKGGVNEQGRRDPNWIELWTFTEVSYMFRAPAEVRRRFQQEVFENVESRDSAQQLLGKMLSGEPATEHELAAVLPLFDRTRDLVESAAWKRHLDARRRMGDDIPD